MDTGVVVALWGFGLMAFITLIIIIAVVAGVTGATHETRPDE